MKAGRNTIAWTTAAPTARSSLPGHGLACMTRSRQRLASSMALQAPAKPLRDGPAPVASGPGHSSLASAASSSTTNQLEGRFVYRHYL
eukprot:11189170-Lingulodinium_polyedra.AAC.1